MTIPSEQQDVARFLSELAGGSPRETHISAVFIGGDTVWKLKKSVRLPFLDFTTLDAREHFLRRELEINKPAAPGLYRDVVGIARREDGTLQLSDDAPIEFVLRMARVPDGDFLDVIASHDGLRDELLDALGDTVAAYHARIPRVEGVDFEQSMRRITEGNVRSALAAEHPEAELDAWQRRMMEAIESRRTWFAARSAAGFVRRCHGDLHLGNICLWEGKPAPFDALEFDEALATIDVGYDLAFLLMDLDRRASRAAANRVMNRYVARSGDAAIVAGFPMFLSQRAMIRAHVLASMGPEHGQESAAYLAAAGSYLDPVMPVVIAIGGLQGTGKSTLARALAPEIEPAPGALVLRSDETRKRLHGVPPEARLPPSAYSAAANAAINEAVVEQARVAAEAGHAVIVDATFLDPAVRVALERAVTQAGTRFLGVWLVAPLSLLEERIAARSGDASDATVDVLRRSAQDAPDAGDWLQVDASDGRAAVEAVRGAI
jgi:aminoglycoside phosphotransferase family enzyme/predicted kinase